MLHVHFLNWKDSRYYFLFLSSAFCFLMHFFLILLDVGQFYMSSICKLSMLHAALQAIYLEVAFFEEMFQGQS